MYDLDEGRGEARTRERSRIGNQIAVAPDYPGRATTLPQYRNGWPGTTRRPRRRADGWAARRPAEPRRPGARADRGHDGRHDPLAARHPLAAARSGRDRSAHPPARSRGTPTGTTTAPTGGPTGPAKAADTVNIPGTVYDEKTRGASYSSVVTQSGDQTTIRDRKRELGMVTTGTETTDGELTNRKETVKGAGFGVGGNVVGAQYGRSRLVRGRVGRTVHQRRHCATSESFARALGERSDGRLCDAQARCRRVDGLPGAPAGSRRRDVSHSAR